MTDEIKKEDTETREFTENPFDHQNRRPEDVVRLFYIHDVPVIPVISKRGMLIGILRKESVISELSDIERVEKLKIDEFITRLAVKMNLDDLLQYGKIREFVVINIFGELQGRWSRIQLFAACDNAKISHQEDEIKKQQEDQVLEWMIYHILEHVPRALYALNEKGKTIFYNSLFEDLYEEKKNSEVDVEAVEKTISDPAGNELFSGLNQDDLHFYNSDLDIFYEKIPMTSSGKKSGFLIFCDKKSPGENEFKIPGVDLRNKSLLEILEAVERHLIVDAIRTSLSLENAAEKLKLTKQALTAKIKKFGIHYNEKK
jgi:transcriptional regulator with PAS, ATPase and Fis domain